MTPEKLDPRTLGHNFFWTSYPGSNNPKKYNGDDDYSYNPSSPIEQAGRGHDLEYRGMGISGFSGLFGEKKAIKADWVFVAKNLKVAYNPLANPINRVKGYLLGVGLGLIALPKTIQEIMPTKVNPHY